MRRILLAAIAAAFAGAAGAQSNLGFLDNAPIQKMTKADIALLMKHSDEALSRNADGHTSAWANPQTGASGTITPLKTFTQRGMKCREAEYTNFAGGFRGASRHTLCLQGGTWKIAS
jgi:surface antigen